MGKCTVSLKVTDANGDAVSGADIAVRINSVADSTITTTSDGSARFIASWGSVIGLSSSDVKVSGYRVTIPKVTELFLGVFKADIANEVNQGSGGGSGSLETPDGDVDGVNDTFTASGTITKVFRNGVMEWRLGTPTGNTFVFDTPPSEGDDIEVEV